MAAVEMGLGDVGSAVASENIAANLLVQRGTTAGQVGLCGASGLPAGSVTEAFASGARVNYFRTKGIHLVIASATIAAGDFLKAAAAGKVAPESTATTRTAATIGIAVTAGATDGSLFKMEWL